MAKREKGAGKRRPKGARKCKPEAAPWRTRVRMYRQGIGDCLLISLPRSDGDDLFHMMIDCGVLLGTPDARGWMQRIVADIAETTGGRIDLLAVTHEHWDHLSGFLHAADELSVLEIGAVWMSWAENPEDPQARALEGARAQAIQALRLAEARLGLAGHPDAGPLADLLGFFGSRGRTTRDALAAARELAPGERPRYLEPGETVALDRTGARIHVLGPPRDEALLRSSNPRKGEAYGLAAGLGVDTVLELTQEKAPDGPFAARWGIPLEVAQSLPFFRRTLDAPGQEWRRIDRAWLDGALDLALRLDRDTNNSSLVLALELDGGDVLLLAADAQAGNWRSWQDLAFEDCTDPRTGPELLARTILYKVGHHGSHNATLRAEGLEQMTALRTALVPVDETVARARNWTRIPLPELLSALDDATGGRVLRADAPPPDAADIDATALRYDVFV
ncbi:hypothetical protein [Pararhodobacter sp. SW119]|uniref:hypothetical protein n=1 Tax=Pararhodobacter sp. SW119 TaxID=2780075 RepID=UPI001ADF0589|nr:hypothetical protein [Pararhodobacter sp. SW119]